MNTEAKVGAFSIIGLALLVGIILFLSNFSFGNKSQHQFKIIYHQVTGLKMGANVSFAGVQAGKVVGIKAQDNKVVVEVKVNGDLDIPKNSIFTINSDGLMGEKFISIIPPEQSTGPVADGEVVVGVDEKGLDYLLTQASSTIVQMQELMDNMNKVMGNKQVQDALVASAINLQNLTKHMNDLVGVMARVANANEGNVDQLIGDMTVAMANLKTASGQVEKMLANIEPVISDPTTAENLKKAIDLAGSLADKAEGTMDKLQKIKGRGEVGAYYGGAAKRFRVDANAYVNVNENNFLKVGGNDIGGDNTTANLQMGSSSGKVTTRGGIVNSRLGLGVDYKPNDKTTITAEVYNPNHPKVNVSTAYEIQENLYLEGKGHNVNNGKDRAVYMGLKKAF